MPARELILFAAVAVRKSPLGLEWGITILVNSIYMQPYPSKHGTFRARFLLEQYL